MCIRDRAGFVEDRYAARPHLSDGRDETLPRPVDRQRCLVAPGPAERGHQGVDRLAGHIVVDQRLGEPFGEDRRIVQAGQAQRHRQGRRPGHREGHPGADPAELVARPVSYTHLDVYKRQAKDGAESVYAVGLPDGRGVAVKIADGYPRAAPVVCAQVLRRLGVDESALRELEAAPILSLIHI